MFGSGLPSAGSISCPERVYAMVCAAAGANPPPGLVVPDFTTAAAYGVAVAQFIPPSSGQVQFQVTCSSCLLFVQVRHACGK